MLWNLNYQQRLGSNVQITINYDGKKKAKGQIPSMWVGLRLDTCSENVPGQHEPDLTIKFPVFRTFA